MAMPLGRVLRHRHAVAMGGLLPLPSLEHSSLPESLKSQLYNSQSFGWDVDVAGRGQRWVVRSGARQRLPGPATRCNRGDWRLDGGTPSPSPRPHIGVGVPLNFFPLFLGGVNDR